MGVTTGGLFPGETQDITITIPTAPPDADSAKLAQDLQDVIDAFNAEQGAIVLEVL